MILKTLRFSGYSQGFGSGMLMILLSLYSAPISDKKQTVMGAVFHRIQFIIDMKNYLKLPLLAVMVGRITNGTLETSVYRKPT